MVWFAYVRNIVVSVIHWFMSWLYYNQLKITFSTFHMLGLGSALNCAEGTEWGMLQTTSGDFYVKLTQLLIQTQDVPIK